MSVVSETECRVDGHCCIPRHIPYAATCPDMPWTGKSSYPHLGPTQEVEGRATSVLRQTTLMLTLSIVKQKDYVFGWLPGYILGPCAFTTGS